MQVWVGMPPELKAGLDAARNGPSPITKQSVIPLSWPQARHSQLGISAPKPPRLTSRGAEKQVVAVLNHGTSCA